MEAKYCLSCGAELETRDIGGTIRQACPRCSFVHWGHYSVGVGALVLRQDKLLLVRRAQDPGRGYWTVPGGYIEQLEPIAETVEREVFEECGVRAAARRIAALRDQPRAIHNVYIAFEMAYLEGEPRPDGVEVDAAGFYGRDEMETMHVAPFTRWLADVAFRAGQPGSGLLLDQEPIVSLPGYGLFRGVSN